MKALYRKAEFEIKRNSAAEAAAKAKRNLDRMEAVKQLETWSASFVIPHKKEAASPPAQSKSIRPVSARSSETPKLPV